MSEFNQYEEKFIIISKISNENSSCTQDLREMETSSTRTVRHFYLFGPNLGDLDRALIQRLLQHVGLVKQPLRYWLRHLKKNVSIASQTQKREEKEGSNTGCGSCPNSMHTVADQKIPVPYKCGQPIKRQFQVRISCATAFLDFGAYRYRTNRKVAAQR